METAPQFLTIKQAAQQFGKSEQTIRRLVKLNAKTNHILTEQTPKGNAYLISQSFLTRQYPSAIEQLPEVIGPDQVLQVIQLQEQLAQRDQTIQQLQHRLLEQNDVLNALTSQVNSQRIGHIEELLLRQNEQLGELQKRLPELALGDATTMSPPELPKKGFWQRVFNK